MRVTPSNAPSKIMLFFRGIVAEFGVVAVAAAPFFSCVGTITVRRLYIRQLDAQLVHCYTEVNIR